MPLLKYQKWEETLPHGPPLCALCMGNDKYESSSFPALNSCVKDAKAVAAQVRDKLGQSGAWATVADNIKDKAAMELKVKDFLRQIRQPPRMVLVYVSGHGVQEGDEIFIVPTHASPSTLEELRAQCLSHDELFRLLKTDLEERDVPDQGKARIQVKDIIFLVILDTCRSRLDGVQLEESYSAELDPKNPPNVWALCAAASRHNEALENPAISQELSAFTHYLINEDTGLFEPNTPVRDALETTCSKLRDHPQGQKQNPTLMGLERIPSDFCLLPFERPSAVFDICVCYRRDTDEDHAQFICDKLKNAVTITNAALRIFLNADTCEFGWENVQIASAIAHSTMVVLIVSAKTFEGVDKLGTGPCQEPLADFLLQCELIVEIYGRRQEKMMVKPILFGVEQAAPGGGKLFEAFDVDALWPEMAPACCVKSISEKAKRLIRCLGLEMARSLTISNLTIPSCGDVASLMSGRTIKDTLRVMRALRPQCVEGRKHPAGAQVSRDIIAHLPSSKRPLESDESEAFASSKVPRHNPEVLWSEQRAAARMLSSRTHSPAPTDQSGASTTPGTPQSPHSQDVLAMHVDSPVSDFRDDMRKMIDSFLRSNASGEPAEQSAQRRWKLCELLLVAFMRDKVAPSCDSESAGDLDAWQERCETPTENLFQRFHEMLSLMKPPVLSEINLQLQENQKPDFASIFVIDWVAQHSPWKLPITKQPDWQNLVVKKWFEVGDTETAEAFVERAEDFLQGSVRGNSWGAKILGKVIETNSYVIFFWMEALLSLLFREFFKQQKTSKPIQQDFPAPVNGSPILPPIRLVVSSLNAWHWSSADEEGADISATHKAVVSARCALQRITSLPDQLLEANACLLSKIDFVEWEPARPEPSDAVGQHTTSFEVPASDVLVRGRGSIEDMLKVLHDIAHTCGHEAQNPNPRMHAQSNELEALVTRVRGETATVVLRKLFLQGEESSAVQEIWQEIWIKDQHHPNAETHPLGSYAVLQLRHARQERICRVEDIEQKHLESADYINVRHILSSPVLCEDDEDPQLLEESHPSDDSGPSVPTRGWGEPTSSTDFPRLAGRAERRCLELLGFSMHITPDDNDVCSECTFNNSIALGHGVHGDGKVCPDVLRKWGVLRNGAGRYSYVPGVWWHCKCGYGRAVQKVLEHVRNGDFEEKIGHVNLQNAVNQLRVAEDMRQKDGARHGGMNGSHQTQFDAIQAARKKLHSIHANYVVSMSRPSTATDGVDALATGVGSISLAARGEGVLQERNILDTHERHPFTLTFIDSETCWQPPNSDFEMNAFLSVEPEIEIKIPLKKLMRHYEEDPLTQLLRAIRRDLPVEKLALKSTPKWAALPAPEPPKTPYCILFVGANSAKESQLNLESEMRQIQDAFIQRHGSQSWGDNVIFKHSFFSSTADLSRDLRLHDPAGLHFSCHGYISALALFGKDLAAQDLVKFIASWCTTGKRLQFIIANACDSAEIVQTLSQHVDFVIGHSTPVADADAVNFARELYAHLGAGESLELSFNAAKMVSSPYCLLGRKNAGMFRLLPPRLSETAKSGVSGQVCAPSEAAGAAGQVSAPNDAALAETAGLENFLTEIGFCHVEAQDLLLDLRKQARIRSLDSLIEAYNKGLLAEIDMPPLAKRWILPKLIEGIQQRQKMHRLEGRTLEQNLPPSHINSLNMVCDLVANGMSPDDDASTAASQSSTPLAQSPGLQSDCSDSDDEFGGIDTVSVRNEGNCDNFQQDMQTFIQDFFKYAQLDDGCNEWDSYQAKFGEANTSNWTLSMLLWTHFAATATLGESPHAAWRNACKNSPSQDKLLTILSSCLRDSATTHKHWDREAFEGWECHKEHAECVFITDAMVEHYLNGHAKSQDDWNKTVLQDWICNDEPVSDFLLRANKFLRDAEHSVNGMNIIEIALKTKSYVAFMQMPRLATLLLFGFLESRRLDSESEAGAAGGGCNVLHGFCSFVSSAGHVFSLTEASMPSPDSLPIIIQGLRCLSAGPTPASSVPVSTYSSRLPSLSASKRVSGRASRQEPRMHQAVIPRPIANPSLDINAGIRALEKQQPEMYQKRAKDIFHADTADRSSIYTYLQRLLGQDMAQKDAISQDTVGSVSVGSFIDSASGEKRPVDGGSVALELLSSSSFLDECNQIENTVTEDLRCPISGGLMRDPVTCSDGCTYERAFIVQNFRQAELALDDRHKKKIFGQHLKSDVMQRFTFKSPRTHKELRFKESAGRRELMFNEEISEDFRVKNDRIREKIGKFKEQKVKELNRMRQNAEGEDEKRILRNRHGYTAQAGSLPEVEGLSFDSAKEFFDWMFAGSRARLACLTGPPASGKTIAMQQIVYAAAEDCRARMETRSAMPLLPLFMRAAVLSKLMAESDRFKSASPSTLGAHAGKPEKPLRDVVEMFLAHAIEEGVFVEHSKQVILDLYDFGRVLICIDGLDEAAAHQELLEESIEHAVKSAEQQSQRPLHILLSTREHSYVHSRACLRLGDFNVVHLQPLNEARQKKMIDGRIPSDKVDTFCEQLAAIAGNHQELTTSPFLLSLMIEVYQKEDKIPTRRVELYEKQVTAIVSRCVQGRLKDQDDITAGLQEEKRELAIRFLETLAFVCQMRLATRDFKLEECAPYVVKLWPGTELARSEAERLLFASPVVGLLADVGDKSYRFSHLTQQEYLAARCAVRLYGCDAQGLLDHLHQGEALFSRWKREVLQFTACMMPEEASSEFCAFSEFCQLLLEMEDGTGAYCELVQDFLKERDPSEAVEQMLRDQMQKNRGTDLLLCGLCHPCPEMRSLVLSEMMKFCAPTYPFSDGTVKTLKAIAESTDYMWYTRAAAMLSIAQIAQMKHCSCDDRTATIEWTLRLLQSGSDVLENVHFALVKALGTMLKKGGDSTGGDGIMLHPEDESVILQLSLGEHDAIASALADLKIFSAKLVDWIQDEPSLGRWPMRHVQFMCERVVALNDFARASRLAGSLFHRLHSPSFTPSDRMLLLKGLGNVQGLAPEDTLQQMFSHLQLGDAEQRARVLTAAAELKMQFGSEEARSRLARCLLSEVVLKSASDSTKESLLAYILEKEGEKCLGSALREDSDMFVFLVDIMQQGTGVDQQVVASHLLDFESAHGTGEVEQVALQPLFSSFARVAGWVLQPLFSSFARVAEGGSWQAAKRETIEVVLLTAHVPVLDESLEHFTPGILEEARTQNEACERYCAASLWATSGLLQETSAEEIAAWLQLSRVESERVAIDCQALKHLREPWVRGELKNSGEWEKQVFEMLQYETLGRFIFAMLLSHIRETMKRDPGASEEFKLLSEIIQRWDAETGEKKLERQLLLKELCIGRRDEQLPLWSGMVTKVTGMVTKCPPLASSQPPNPHLQKSKPGDAKPYDATLALRDQYAGIGGSFQPGPNGVGIFVKTVHPGGPLALSGKVKGGDELVAVEGSVVSGMSPKQFAGTLIGPIGTSVTVTMRRAEEQVTFDVTLIRSAARAQDHVPHFRKQGANKPSGLGLRSSPMKPQLAGIGVVFHGTANGGLAVHSFLPGGPGARSQAISVGDALLTVDGVLIDTLGDKELAEKLIGSSGSVVTLEFKRPSGDKYSVELVRQPVNGLQSPS